MTKRYIEELKDVLSKLDLSKIDLLTGKIIEARDKGRNVFILGNGGSASTASHMACDLGKGTLSRFYDKNQKRIRVMSLNDNMATITALANDLTYDEVFSQQLHNLVSKDDLLIVLTGSGKSRNVLNSVRAAKEQGAYIFGLLGFDGGEVARMVDDSIIVQSKNYGIIEDVHLTINHILTEGIKNGNNLVH